MDDSKAIFNQQDRRWSGLKLGNSGLTIGGYGCTITSLCRMVFLMTGMIYTPAQIVKKLSFTNDGLLYWESIKNVGLKATRVKGNPTMDILSKNAGKMIIELNYNPRHWVTVESIGTFGAIKVMDPLKGDFSSKSQSEISGYTMLEALDKPVEPVVVDPIPDWQRVAGEKSAEQIWNIAKSKGIVSKDTKFNDPVTAGKMMIYLARLFPDKF